MVHLKYTLFVNLLTSFISKTNPSRWMFRTQITFYPFKTKSTAILFLILCYDIRLDYLFISGALTVNSNYNNTKLTSQFKLNCILNSNCLSIKIKVYIFLPFLYSRVCDIHTLKDCFISADAWNIRPCCYRSKNRTQIKDQRLLLLDKL